MTAHRWKRQQAPVLVEGLECPKVVIAAASLDVRINTTAPIERLGLRPSCVFCRIDD
jgi:hypothetical protein